MKNILFIIVAAVSVGCGSSKESVRNTPTIAPGAPNEVDKKNQAFNFDNSGSGSEVEQSEGEDLPIAAAKSAKRTRVKPKNSSVSRFSKDDHISTEPPSTVFLGLVPALYSSSYKYQSFDIGWALGYCQKVGGNVPTARELAYFAKSLGAKGIVDACEISDAKCVKVEGENLSGGLESFYYSSKGYRSPEGPRGPGLLQRPGHLWSSTASTLIPGEPLIFGYDTGVIATGGYTGWRSYGHGLNCVSGPWREIVN